jgi:hypothetical protein
MCRIFMAMIYNNPETVHLELCGYRKALVNFRHFLTIVRKLNEPVLRREESITLLNIGDTYSRTGNNDKTHPIRRLTLLVGAETGC